MSHGHDVELSDNEPTASLSIRHPDGRELLVTVTLNTAARQVFAVRGNAGEYELTVTR